MKLGELKSKIRATKGNPSLRITLTPGNSFDLMLMKTPLLAALDEAYDGGKGAETGLTMGDDAMIRAENGMSYGQLVAAALPMLLDLDTPTTSLLDF